MHQVAKAYICGAYAEIREGGGTSPRAGAFRRFDIRGRNMEMRVRGMTTTGDVNRVLRWIYLVKDRVLAARYERQRIPRYL